MFIAEKMYDCDCVCTLANNPTNCPHDAIFSPSVSTLFDPELFYTMCAMANSGHVSVCFFRDQSNRYSLLKLREAKDEDNFKIALGNMMSLHRIGYLELGMGKKPQYKQYNYPGRFPLGFHIDSINDGKKLNPFESIYRVLILDGYPILIVFPVGQVIFTSDSWKNRVKSIIVPEYAPNIHDRDELRCQGCANAMVNYKIESTSAEKMLEILKHGKIVFETLRESIISDEEY
ncbi:hypothetical protein ADUPG1_000838 [Aduncisulcus paluster]|uniref:Uncharacterized protein n=1 Tax=Aduncisulcus paluster TaxID=2918883 RepID=A0ABQ5K885_9EUKA|nr:hypothetical protein ADUPG1_000838 [Aduncisulcus paluster]